MGLKIVYGRAGTGKSTYIFNEIRQNIKNNEKVYIITPEQFTFSQEEKLLNVLEHKAVMQAEVISFERMAYRIINEIQGNKQTLLSDTGRVMLLYNLLEKKKKELSFLGKTKQNTSVMINTITELKKHSITQTDLSKTLDKIEDKYLKIKLNDIFILYKEFQNTIKNEYIDENDGLTILYDIIDKSNMFKNSLIYIDEFMGFTPQEYKIIEKLIHCAKQVTITICTDNLKKEKNPESDIFYSNKQTVEKLINLKGVLVEKSVYLDKQQRFVSKELAHIEQNFYAVPYKKYNSNIKDINLFLAQNPYSELENVANTIYKLTKNEGYRYCDIAIITKNIDTYSSLAKAIFSKYEIPLFIDQKQELSQNIFVKYLLAFLEVFAKNWSYESVISYIKTGLCDITKEESFILENYCIRWGINRSKWYKGNWHIEEEKDEQILEIRKKVVEPLIKFSNKIENQSTVYEKTKQIYEFLEEQKIQEKLSKKAQKLEQEGKLETANLLKVSWDTVIDVLDELILVLGNEKMNFEQYAQVLKAGLSQASLGKIPATQDQVILGDIERSRSHKIKAVFLIGVNDGIFPSVRKDEGFLDDSDRDTLKKFGIELAKGTKDQLYEENFNIYKALTVAEQKLYISYTSSDNEGKTLRPSILITKIKKIFPKIKEESDILHKEYEISAIDATFEEMLVQINNWKDGNEILPIWFEVYAYYNSKEQWKDRLKNAIQGLEYKNKPKPIKKEIMEKINGNTLKTSVSKLEQYRSCPFSFYLKYGLKLEDKKRYKIQSINTGTFMHDVIDSFFETVVNQKIDLKQISDEEIQKIIDQIMDEKLLYAKYYIFTSSPKFQIMTNRLKVMLIKSMKYIIETLSLSDFSILGNEVEFKEGKTYKPIQIELENGKKVEITGKIDRIDIAKDENGKYLRIIDYKSSVKNIDLNEVEHGLQLQLLTYLDAASQNEDAIPAGVLYFNLIDPILKNARNLSQEEVTEELRKEFRMHGLILADIKVVKMMDKTLEKGASNIIPAYIDSKDNVSDTRSSSVSKEQFEYLQKKVKSTIKQIAKEILSGNIDIFPYYSIKKKKTPCQYCQYRSICGFNDSVTKQKYNYIPNDDKQKILERISNQPQT